VRYPAGPFLDPDVVPAAEHRRAARAVVVDEGGRVLLERVRVHTDPSQGSWWELPGGGVEGDESTADAVRREVAEETGHLDLEVLPPLATGRLRYRSATGVAEQHETIHPARLTGGRRRPVDLQGSEAADLLEVSWLTCDELTDGRRLDPPELPHLVRDVLADRPVPRRLRDRDRLGWSAERPVPAELPGGGPRIVGRTVVRDAAPWTSAGHAWLGHLAEHGIEQVPRPLGIDAYGREAVSHLPGQVSDETWPEPLRTVDGMAAVGALLAACAAAASGFVPAADAVWRDGPTPFAQGQVIGHGDVGHANLVWDDEGRPGLIDWEFALPAPPLRDLAEAATWLVPLIEFDHERRGFEVEPDRRRRLDALARAGRTDVDRLLDAVGAYLRWERGRTVELGGLGIRPFDSYLAAGQPASFDRAAGFLRERGRQLR
jgi:8-oxo-dGTP pyrophosphatase MutT (NUDIX family)